MEPINGEEIYFALDLGVYVYDYRWLVGFTKWGMRDMRTKREVEKHMDDGFEGWLRIWRDKARRNVEHSRTKTRTAIC